MIARAKRSAAATCAVRDSLRAPLLPFLEAI
jgi:hypothetical protein